MRKRRLFLFISLIVSLMSYSQETAKGNIPSINKKKQNPTVDSTHVTFSSFSFDSIFLNSPRVIDTLTFHASKFETLERKNTIYSTLSNTGLAHKPMRFNHNNQIGFDMSLPSYSAYLQNENNIISYQSVLPYSELRYVMTTGDKEQHLNFKFGRQFSPRLFISLAVNSELSPGVFINNKSANNYFWINAHYLTKNNRYGASVYAYRNKLEMQENGGIVNDEDYTSHNESDNSVIPTHLNSATNFVIASGLGFEHYFNLLAQKGKMSSPPPTDSIISDTLLLQDTVLVDDQPSTKNRRFTLGRLCHSFSYLNNKLYYNESKPAVTFYQPFDTLFNKSKSTDTTLIRGIRNTLKWNSLGYQKYNDDIPFFIYAGVTHGFYKVKHYDYIEGETVSIRDFNQLSVSGGIIVNLFKSTRITGQGELITLGYQIGDFDLRGQWKQFIGTSLNNYGYATFSAEIKRQSANWFEEHYTSNHFRWDNDFKSATYLNFDLKYSFKDYSIGVKQTSIANLIYFGFDARPAQFDGMFSIREAYLSFYQKLWRFELEGFASLQKSSNEEVVHLPLLHGQLRVGYSQPIFHKAAMLHPSLTIRYFTKYYADAYMPATRTFYLQNDVQIGNFPFIDLALSINVKKADIFVSYSNMFLLTGNYNAFIAPHYPMRDSRIFFGVNWRLFN